jgi:uncharacterized protein YjbI with pentapeptide repeats
MEKGLHTLFLQLTWLTGSFSDFTPNAWIHCNVDIQNVDFQNVEFQNFSFQNINLKNVDFQNGNFQNIWKKLIMSTFYIAPPESLPRRG